jgi:hypothetical protein
MGRLSEAACSRGFPRHNNHPTLFPPHTGICPLSQHTSLGSTVFFFTYFSRDGALDFELEFEAGWGWGGRL